VDTRLATRPVPVTDFTHGYPWAWIFLPPLDKTSHVESRYASNITTSELKNPCFQSKKPNSRFSYQITKLEQSHHSSSSPRNKTKTNVKNINENNIAKTRLKNSLQKTNS